MRSKKIISLSLATVLSLSTVVANAAQIVKDPEYGDWIIDEPFTRTQLQGRTPNLEATLEKITVEEAGEAGIKTTGRGAYTEDNSDFYKITFDISKVGALLRDAYQGEIDNGTIGTVDESGMVQTLLFGMLIKLPGIEHKQVVTSSVFESGAAWSATAETVMLTTGTKTSEYYPTTTQTYLEDVNTTVEVVYAVDDGYDAEITPTINSTYYLEYPNMPAGNAAGTSDIPAVQAIKFGTPTPTDSIDSISVAPTSAALKVGGTESVALTANVTATGNPDKTVAWTVTEGSEYVELSAATGDTVNVSIKDKTITEQKTATIRATAGNKTADVTVTIDPKDPDPVLSFEYSNEIGAMHQEHDNGAVWVVKVTGHGNQNAKCIFRYGSDVIGRELTLPEVPTLRFDVILKTATRQAANLEVVVAE